MKQPFLTLLILFAAQAAIARPLATFTCAGATIVLLDSTEAAQISAQQDEYTREHTPFDLAIRLNRPPSELTEADYLQASARNVRDWPATEQQQLRQAYAHIDSFATAAGLRLHLPDTVKMVKTTAGEEFGAEGFTRGNRIMLNTKAQPISVHLLAHELWHVISRHNAALRDKAYSAFHFKPCNKIVYKPALNNQVITNPDCPFLSHYISLEKDGKQQDMALIFYLKVNYKDGKPEGQELGIGLLALEGDDAHKAPLIRDGKAVIYELSEVPELTKRIGSNTEYLLHVEEVTAEHFAALVSGKQLKEMGYVTGVRRALER